MFIVFILLFMLICNPLLLSLRISQARTSTINRNSNALNGHPCRVPLFFLKGLDVQPLFVTHATALWYIMSTQLMNEEPKLYFLSTFFRNS